MMKTPSWGELSLGQKVLYGFFAMSALAIIGPLALLAMTTVKSLFMAAVYFVGLIAVFYSIPFLHRFFKSMSLKLMKANARMNPIETLEIDLINRKQAFDKFVEFVKKMIAAHTVTQEELNSLKDQFPNRDLLDRQEKVDKMKEAVNVLQVKAQTAKIKLDAYGEEVAFQKSDHKWSKRFGDSMSKLKQVEGTDPLDELLKNESIGQIRQDVALAFAELDLLLAQDDTQAAIELAHFKGSNIIEGDSVRFFKPVTQGST